MARVVPVVAFFGNGTTRAVFCIGRMAFKFACSAHCARCNWYEADLYRRSDQVRRTLLCPPVWCSSFGVVLSCDELIR